MSQTGLTVRSHWHHRCEHISVSVEPFYNLVLQRLATKQIPHIQASKVLWNEGGVISPKREYLRIMLDSNIFDICTAPFGNGTFFSCWVAEKHPSPLWGTLIGLLLVSIGLFTFVLSFIIPIIGFFLWIVCVMVVLVGIPFLILILPHHLQAYVWVTPFLGPLLERLIAPVTYYKIDTSIMAESAIYEAVQEAVAQVTQAQGYRALTLEEKKPIMKGFLQ
jgi:hypothetical protein